MAISYRTGRASRLARLAEVGDLDVTLSRDALLFRPARRSARRPAAVDRTGATPEDGLTRRSARERRRVVREGDH
jgi:hypothetical protein